MNNGLQFTKVSSNLEGDNREMKVWLWDIGPPKPEMPKRPVRPKGIEGDGEFDLAMIEYREAIEDYEKALKAYKALKAEFDDFQSRYGGPYEREFWSVDARDALLNDKAAVDESRQEELRYYISSRTRGYGKVPNGGLPRGMKPGRGHEENMRRAAEGAADMAALRRTDPVFGSEEPRP